MEFTYVNISGEEHIGWLNLFYGDHCIAMVSDVGLANQLRLEIKEKVFEPDLEKLIKEHKAT